MKRIKVIQHNINQADIHENEVNQCIENLDSQNQYVVYLSTAISQRKITTVIAYDLRRSPKPELFDPLKLDLDYAS